MFFFSGCFFCRIEWNYETFWRGAVWRFHYLNSSKTYFKLLINSWVQMIAVKSIRFFLSTILQARAKNHINSKSQSVYCVYLTHHHDFNNSFSVQVWHHAILKLISVSIVLRIRDIESFIRNCDFVFLQVDSQSEVNLRFFFTFSLRILSSFPLNEWIYSLTGIMASLISWRRFLIQCNSNGSAFLLKLLEKRLFFHSQSCLKWSHIFYREISNDNISNRPIYANNRF